MGTLTPDPLLPAPGQVSLVHGRALPDIPSPPTPGASAPAVLPVPGRLGPRFAFPAIGGSSDFAHCSQSRQSHEAVSSLCRGRSFARSSTDYLFTSSCSPRRVTGTQLLSVVWREAPPGRDFHPPVHARSQAHERSVYAAEMFSARACPEMLHHSPSARLLQPEGCVPWHGNQNPELNSVKLGVACWIVAVVG